MITRVRICNLGLGLFDAKVPSDERFLSYPSQIHPRKCLSNTTFEGKKYKPKLKIRTLMITQSAFSSGYMVFGHMIFSAIWSDFCWSHLLMVTK